MEIRELGDAGWPQVWPIVRDVIRARDTFTYDPEMTAEQARGIWVEAPPGHAVVAVEEGPDFCTPQKGPNKTGPGPPMSTGRILEAGEARGHSVGTGPLPE